MQPHPRFDRSARFETERGLDRYIEAFVPVGARVMDLGCGKGELLERLIQSRRIEARGVEISSEGVKACIAKGLAVYQADIDEGFADLDDGVFDIVILNLTLSMLHYPDHVLGEIVRIGKRGIITFHNAAYLPRRHRFLRFGTIGSILPGETPWYQNPHIHPFSIADFEALCAERRVRIVDRTFVDAKFEPLAGVFAPWPQSWAYAAVYLLERG